MSQGPDESSRARHFAVDSARAAISMCSRHPAVSIQDTGQDSPDETTCPVSEDYLLPSACRGMRPSCQGVFTCSRHTAVPICERTRTSGQNYMPRSGRMEFFNFPFSGYETICRCPKQSICTRHGARGTHPSYQGVFTCSRHTAVTIRHTTQGGPDEAIFRGPDGSVCARHRAVGVARPTKACSRARGTLPSASGTRAKEFRTKPFTDVRTEFFAHVTVLAAVARAAKASLCAQGTLPSPSDTEQGGSEKAICRCLAESIC